MRYFLSVLFAGLAAAADDAATIENLDKSWTTAVLSKDFAALDRMLAPDLIYAHASGIVDTKQQYLDKLRSGRQVYKTMEQRKVSVRLHGSSAVTHSWMRVTGVNAQGPYDDKVMMIHLWVKAGNAWRLAAHQTTRVDSLP